MPQKSSVIKCHKCGYVSNIISDTCIQCGSRLEKICGDCGFSNAVEKNYCDQCGAPLILKAGQPAGPALPVTPTPGQGEPPPKKPFQFEMQPIQETVAEKDESFRSRPSGKVTPPIPPPPVSGPPLPAAPAMPPGPDNIQPPPRSFASKNIPGALAIAGLLILLGFFLYLIVTPYIPRFSLKMTANNYLKRLSTGRYEDAYAMLSTNSKSACSMKNYVDYSRQYYGQTPAWEFKGVEIFAMEPDAAMVRYQLREGTGPWHADYISFVNEHGKWTRPYIWMFFEPIDTAIARQDYPQALFLAQKIYLTDPMDPRTSGYLCVSEFFMGLYANAADSCRKTVLSASAYPVGFTAEEIFWFRFYYADSLRFVQKLEPALEEYGKLLQSDVISTKKECPVLLSRADTYVRLSKYDAALNDMLKADGVCTDTINHAEVARRMRFMNGDARADAISFAQRTKSRADLPPFGELRRKELDSIAARLGPKNMRYMPQDKWAAEHLSGPEYRVVLRQENINPGTRQKETRNIYVFMVNLWTGVIRFEEGALPPQNKADPDMPAK